MVHVDTNSSFKCTDGKSKLQVERFSHGQRKVIPVYEFETGKIDFPQGVQDERKDK